MIYFSGSESLVDTETPKRATSIPKDLASAADTNTKKLSQLQRPASKEKVLEKSPSPESRVKKTPVEEVVASVSKVILCHKVLLCHRSSS